MNQLNFISLFITALLSVFTTLYYPKLKRVIIQQRTCKNRKLTSLIEAEVAKQLKEILNDN